MKPPLARGDRVPCMRNDAMQALASYASTRRFSVGFFFRDSKLNIQDPQLQDRRCLSQARSQSPISQCHKRVRLLAIVRPDSLPSSRLPGRATLSRGATCRRRRWRQSRCAPTDRPLVDASRRSPRLPSGAVRGSGIRWSGKNSTCDHLPPSVKFDVRGRLPVSGLHRSTPV